MLNKKDTGDKMLFLQKINLKNHTGKKIAMPAASSENDAGLLIVPDN